MGAVYLSCGRSPAAQALARHLAGLGYRVVVNGAAVDGCLRVDADPAQPAALAQCLDGLGALDGAVYFLPGPEPVSIERANDDDIASALRTGALAALTLVAAAGRLMAEAGRGAIILVGDVHAEKPTGAAPLHAMQAGALQNLCREAALDYGRRGVSCFHVMAGPTREDEPLASRTSNHWAGPAYRHPDGRLPGAGCLNALIAFLLTPGARPLNGADLRADAGYVMYYGLQPEEAVP